MTAKTDKKQTQKLKEFRICVCGPSHVGKTAIINRLVNNAFYAEYNKPDDDEIQEID